MATPTGEMLKAGWGTADITPTRTSELFGQYYQRVAKSVRDPLSVTALAMEQANDDPAQGQAILVSCDQAMIDRDLLQTVRERLAKQIPDFDGTRLVIGATHTHNAPAASDPLMWWRHDPSLLTMDEFRPVLLDALTSAAVQAWKSKADAHVGAATGFASVGHCRRPLYLDGSSEMYGATDRPDFIGIEGGQDDTVGVIGVWTGKGELTGLLVNVVCPSQVMEATYVVTADMYGEMRRQLRERLGKNVSILCQVGAAGDQAPRDLTRPHRGGTHLLGRRGHGRAGRQAGGCGDGGAAPRTDGAGARDDAAAHGDHPAASHPHGEPRRLCPGRIRARGARCPGAC